MPRQAANKAGNDGGRKSGAKKYNADVLLKIIDDIKPPGAAGWGQVAIRLIRLSFRNYFK